MDSLIWRPQETEEEVMRLLQRLEPKLAYCHFHHTLFVTTATVQLRSRENEIDSTSPHVECQRIYGHL